MWAAMFFGQLDNPPTIMAVCSSDPEHTIRCRAASGSSCAPAARASLGGEAEAHGALLAVEDDDAVGRAARSARRCARLEAALAVARPSVTASTSAAALGSRRRSVR